MGQEEGVVQFHQEEREEVEVLVGQEEGVVQFHQEEREEVEVFYVE